MPDQPDITIPAPPNRVCYQCVISTCGWHLDEPPPPNIAPEALAHIFGLGMIAQQAMNEHMAMIEKQLREHFETHRLEEFVGEISQLRNLCIGLTNQLVELGQILRAPGAEPATEPAPIYDPITPIYRAPHQPTLGLITGI